MLELGSKTITVDGITVFADDSDKDQFWYLPGPVQLARRTQDNRAAFTLIKYGNVSGDKIEGKGFLMFEVNLKLDPNVERKIMSKISQLTKGNPKLAAVPFDSGTVECISLDLQGGGGTTAELSADGSFRAVEKILGGTVPSLHGNNNAAFSLSLSGEGVTILENVFKDKGTPIGALYTLNYSGLRPALEVEIKANMKRVYDHFSAGLDAQVYFVRAGIDAGFEKLVEDKVIEINVINYSTEDDRSNKEDWALNFFKEKLLDEWFRPTLTPGQLAGGIAEAENLSSVQSLANTLLRPPVPPTPPPLPNPLTAPSATHQPRQQQPRPDENSGSPESRAVVTNPPVISGNADNAAATATAMPPQTPPPSATPQASGVRPQTAPNAANLNVNTSLVSFKLKMIKQIEEKTLTFKFTRSEAVKRVYAPQGFFGLFAEDLNKSGHFFEIDGDDAFFREFKVFVETPFDKESIGLSSAHVQLKYGEENDPDKKNKDFVIDKTTPEKVEWLVKTIPGINKYGYTVQYHFDPDSDWKGDKTSYNFDMVMTEDRTLLLHPFDSLNFIDIGISASQIDWNEVANVEVHLDYGAEDQWQTSEIFFFSESDKEDKHWKIRSSDTENKAFSYFIKYQMNDGSFRETPKITTEATKVLLNNPFKTIDIEFIPLFQPNAVKMVFIDVEYDDDENHIRIRERLKLNAGSADPVPFKLNVIDDVKGTYRYQTTIVGNDNTLKRNKMIETQETLVGVDIA